MHFTFNNISSETFGLKVKSTNHLSLPAKKIESIEIPGRTGNLIIDDGSRRNLSIEVVCFLDCRADKNIAFKTRQISNWLQGPIGYRKLVFSDGVTFNAICNNQIDIAELINYYGEIMIHFDAYEVIE